MVYALTASLEGEKLRKRKKKNKTKKESDLGLWAVCTQMSDQYSKAFWCSCRGTVAQKDKGIITVKLQQTSVSASWLLFIPLFSNLTF